MNKKRFLLLTISIIILLIIISMFIPISKDTILHKIGYSYEIYDRNGILLRKGLSSNGYYFSWVKYSELPDYLIKALIAVEDKRFYKHPGVDYKSLFSALINNISNNTIKTGASTITMQIARNIYNLPRNLFSKLFEMWLSFRLENSFSKKELIELYFNTIPFGKMIVGIKMAARLYFNKSVKYLSPSESALLIAILKYPSLLNTDLLNKKIKNRQKYVLKQLLKQKLINLNTFKRAITEKIKFYKPPNRFLAPHFINFILSYIKKNYKNKLNEIAKIYTTLDYRIQKSTLENCRTIVKKLKDKKISNASAIILNNKTSELIAMVGSVNYFSDKKSGQINGTIAIRPPGSTLKPFTYGTAIDTGIITAGTVIADVPTYIKSNSGDFIPINYNRTYNGPIVARKALACSYNVSAAQVISKVSVNSVYRKLKKCGFASLKAAPSYYGTSLTLGGADVTLLELVNSYIVFSNNGIFKPVRFIKEIRDKFGKNIANFLSKKEHKIFSKETTFIISNILSDNKAREDSFSILSPLNFPFFCAAKTGTSVGFRNNWTIGFSHNYTAGVWVGNFDNTPMQGISGITGAANIFRNIMLDIEKDYDFKPDIPNNVIKKTICTKSGLIPKLYCDSKISEYFIKGTEPIRKCNTHYRIPYSKKTRKIVFIKNTNQMSYRNIEWKDVLLLPDIYNRWLRDNGFRTPDKETKKYISWLKNKKQNQDSKPKIIYPDNDDVFIIDPIFSRKYQNITFQSIIPGDATAIYWKLNNKFLTNNAQPSEYTWKIERGKYKLQLITKNNKNNIIKSKSIIFTVN